MSVPRLGFMDNARCAMEGLVPLGIPLRYQGGAFWGQSLTKCMETILEQDEPDAILCLDYDTVFTRSDVSRLVQLMMVHPEADAIAALQSSRHLETALFTVRDDNGEIQSRLNLDDLQDDLLKVSSAHFGLTLIRTDKLRAMPKPWFMPVPSADGSWDEDKIDEDVNFWVKWGENGNSLYSANHVVAGHLELCVRWPGEDLQVILQPVREYKETGKAPDGVWK